MLGDKLFTEKIAKGKGFVGPNVKGGFRQNPNKNLAGTKEKPKPGESQNALQGTEGHKKALAPTPSEKINTDAAPVVSGGGKK